MKSLFLEIDKPNICFKNSGIFDTRHQKYRDNCSSKERLHIVRTQCEPSLRILGFSQNFCLSKSTELLYF